MPLQNLELHTVHKKMPLMSLPVTTCVVQLESARVLVGPSSVHTPEQLRGFGDITHVVIPSLFHTAGAPNAVAAFPEARVWGPIGAAAKLPSINWAGTLGVDPWPFEDGLAVVPLEGMPKVHESVLFHRASKSLLVTDLVFNVVDASGLGAWIILNIFGTWRRLGVSRLFLMAVKEQAAFRQSLKRVSGLDFENLIASHGAPVLGDGKTQFRSALAARSL